MTGHLFESTVLLAMAILVAQIPRLAARTRYTIVFAALMKFAIPSAVVPRALAFFGIDLARLPKGTIIINALGPFVAGSAASTTTSRLPMIVISVWLSVAVVLLVRALRGRNALLRALASGRDANAGETDALDRACARVHIERPVRLLVSASMASPATAGVLQPIILLPASMSLSASELETILTHECAHIARRDNLLSLIETVAGCALWFHPLVWVARRVLDGSREEACDAIVLDSGDASVYITALKKVCGAAIGPRVAAVSCIVSNTIRERMEAIMRFGTRRLLNHRAVAASAISLLAVATIGIGVARALPSEDGAKNTRHRVDVTLTRDAKGTFVFDIAVRDRMSGEILASAKLKAKAEQPATLDGTDPEVHVRAIAHENGTADIDARFPGEPLIMMKVVPQKAVMSKTPPSDGISIDLKDADLRDVLQTFAQLTKTEILVDDDITGKVTVKLVDTPWTQAFDGILANASLRSERKGDTIYVHRK